MRRLLFERPKSCWLRNSGKIEVEMAEDHLQASDIAKLEIQALGTGRLRCRLSLVLQRALACRTL